jgi:hypothetical protein
MAPRWRMAVMALPLVALVAVAKIIVTELGAEDIELNPLYTGLVAGNIFLLGFLLAGTLADYKESEKLPVEIAASLDSIGDEFRIVAEGKGRAEGTGAAEGKAALAHLAVTVRTILAWLYGNQPFGAVLDRVEALSDHFVAIEPHTQVTFVSRIKGEQNAVRRMLMRVYSIHVTSFVVAGFMVAALTSILLIGVLLFIDVGALATDLILLCTLTFLLGYVLLLIRDLDDPFEYTSEGEKAGSAEAALDPLVQLSERLPAAGD